MKQITHFNLPEHTNKLYKNEASSSISLAREVADKINELVDAYNTFSSDDLLWKQEQEGRIKKGVIYMKDNLINSMNDLMELLKKEGFIDDRIEYHCNYLKERLDNLLTADVVDGELIDIRVDASGKTHTSAGESIRQNTPKKHFMIEDDLNNYQTPCVAVCSVDAKNHPPHNSTGIVMVEVTGSWVVQRWYSFYDNKIFYRTCRKDNWSEWFDYNHETDKYLWVDAGEDLNDIKPEASVYGMASVNAVNTPLTESNGMVAFIPFSSGGATWFSQIWINTDLTGVYIRQYRKEWLDWIPLFVKSDIVTQPKTVVFMGDSILGNNQSDTGVVKLYEKLTGNKCHNFAMGGTRMKNHADNWKYLDGQTLCKAIVRKNFTEQKNCLSKINGLDYFLNTINKLEKFDFSEADYLVINWGTNDWNGGTTFDDYYTALEEFVVTMQTAYPNLTIVKMTPTQRFFKTSSGLISGNTKTNSNGDTLKQFVENEHRITDDYNIPVIDMFNIGINTMNYSYNFPNEDYTHHNDKGRMKIADKLSREV